MAPAGLRVSGGGPLRGAVEPPPDPAIAQVALVIAALGAGESRLEARLDRGQLGTTLEALRELGVECDRSGAATVVHGRGLDGLRMPRAAIACGRSPHTLALIAGLLAGQRFGTRLVFEPAGEPPALEHLVGALRARGAHIAAQNNATGGAAAIVVAPLIADEALRGIECALPVPDPLAKSALLISGLYASGPTAVSEPLLSADHVERMLMALELPLRRFGSMAGFDPAAFPPRFPALGHLQLPASATTAAAAAALAIAIPDSHIALRDVACNPTRSGFFDALRLFGARLRVIAKGDRAGREPVAELQLKHARVRGGQLGGELVLRCGDTLPAFCLLGARSTHGLELLDAEHYASAASPLWLELTRMLAAFGVESRVAGAGLSIAPALALRPATVDARGDHRLALCAVLLALAADGESTIRGADALEYEWPGLLECLAELGARITPEGR